MAIKKDVITSYLGKMGIAYEDKDSEKSPDLKYIMAGFESSDDEGESFTYGMLIRLEEPAGDGYEFLQFRALQFSGLPEGESIINSPYFSELLKYLVAKNYERKIGAWALDPADGDFYLSAVVSIEDSTSLTEKQFKRIWLSIQKSTKDSYGDIRRILKQGKADLPKKQADMRLQIIEKLTNNGQLELIAPMFAYGGDLGDLNKLVDQAVASKTWKVVKDILAPGEA